MVNHRDELDSDGFTHRRCCVSCCIRELEPQEVTTESNAHERGFAMAPRKSPRGNESLGYSPPQIRIRRASEIKKVVEPDEKKGYSPPPPPAPRKPPPPPPAQPEKK